jgi:hypothetical protein
VWGFFTNDAPGDFTGWYTLTCGAGWSAISGACGHRDANGASDDINVNYTGPDFGNIRVWRCFFRNNSGSSRAVRVGVLCTTAPVSVVAPDPAPDGSEMPAVPTRSQVHPSGIRLDVYEVAR